MNVYSIRIQQALSAIQAFSKAATQAQSMRTIVVQITIHRWCLSFLIFLLLVSLIGILSTPSQKKVKFDQNLGKLGFLHSSVIFIIRLHFKIMILFLFVKTHFQHAQHIISQVKLVLFTVCNTILKETSFGNSDQANLFFVSKLIISREPIFDWASSVYWLFYFSLRA